MTSGNRLYLPKRWYTPEWSGLFVAVFCGLFSFGYCVSPVAFGWMESMNIDQFCAVEKTAFYNFHKVTDFDDAFAVRLHRDATYTIQIDVLYADLGRSFDTLTFPLNDYMVSLRIFFSDFENFDSMWEDLAVSSVPSAFIPTQLDPEYQVLSLTESRVKESSPAIRNGKHKQFANSLLAALQVANTILKDTEDVFMADLTFNEVSFDEYIGYYETRIEEEAIEALSKNNFPVKYVKDVVTLFKLYARDSVVPYMNRYLKNRNDSLEDASPSFALQRPFGDSDSLILITERHYKNRTFSVPLLPGSAPVSVTVTQVTRVLFGSDANFNATKMLNNFQGYGAYSIMKMECIHLPEELPSLREKYNVSNMHCVTGKTYLNVYNTLVASPILSLVSTALTVDQMKRQRDNDTPLVSRMKGTDVETIVAESIDYERSLAYHSTQYPESDRFRVLSLGLGGGELHMYLLNHFPTAEVTSVEISEDIFRSSQEALGLRYGVCRASRLVNPSDAAMLTSLDVADAAFASQSENQSKCRSQVVISDAWDYILNHAKQKDTKPEKEQDSQFFDLIVFDVYDQAATRWDGNLNTASSPCVDRASSDASLRAIRSVLRPAAGLAVFHLHDDNQFQHYYDQILRIFGSDQVVLFSVTSNDYMVVAARSKFRTPAHLLSGSCAAGVSFDGTAASEVCSSASSGREVHPCEQPLNFTLLATERNQLYGFSNRISKAALYSLNCKDKQDYLLE